MRIGTATNNRLFIIKGMPKDTGKSRGVGKNPLKTGRIKVKAYKIKPETG
jgi:hypothetical protein